MAVGDRLDLLGGVSCDQALEAAVLVIPVVTAAVYQQTWHKPQFEHPSCRLRRDRQLKGAPVTLVQVVLAEM